MSNRYLIASACTMALIATASSAATLTLQLYPLTREVRLSNPSSSPVTFVFYEIKSPSGGLNGANGVWTSISDRYDVSGNGFIDPVNNWTELSSISTDLSEGVFTGDGGTLAPFRSISLGRIWNPSTASAASLVPTVALSQGQSTVPMDKELAVDGDYNSDHHVDQQDYTVWRIVFGRRISRWRMETTTASLTQGTTPSGAIISGHRLDRALAQALRRPCRNLRQL